LVQFQLLHSKFHLCSVPTRQLLLSTYVKFINLFPEIKGQIQAVLRSENHLRNADVELQQRAVEYMQLSSVATTDVLATVLEEMPPFPERESSILAKLKKRRPDKVNNVVVKGTKSPASVEAALNNSDHTISSGHHAVSAMKAPEQTQSPPRSGVTSDLLGLASNSQNSSGAYSGVLVDVLGDIRPSGDSGVGGLDMVGSAVAEDTLNKFICKNNGGLFENDLLQIGVKSEFRQNLGRLTLFYGNKTAIPFNSFVTQIECTGVLSSQLNCQAKPVDSVIEGGAQKQQLINIECASDFSDVPSLAIQFQYGSVPQKMSVRLPVMATKFVEPTIMDSAQFFARWKLLSQPAQECQRIIKATQTMDHESTRAKLIGVGLSVLDGVDPNPENFVCAGILHTTTVQVGCLARLEPNSQALMYRLTVRASKDNVAKRLVDLFESQL